MPQTTPILTAAFLLITELARLLFCQQAYAQTVYQDNGTIRVGRDSLMGGAIMWLGESNGQNLVNNWDCGRQIQMNVRDLNGDYNPTQAGDGPNASGSLILYSDSQLVFSKSVPLLFYNLPPYSGPPRPADGQLFFMWSEFLPNSNQRGLLVKTYYENRDPRPGECFTNYVSPADILNYTPFTRLTRYGGTAPWTNAPVAHVTDPTGDFLTTRFSMTERWYALTDNSGYGLAHLGDHSYGDLLFYNTPGSECKSVGGNERFAMRIEPSDTFQQREGWGIYYLGDVGEARQFFSTYRPMPSGSFADDFDDPRLLNWYRNNNPIEIVNGAVKVGPDNSWVNDLSLINKYFADATFEVDVRLETGASWYGMAVCKTGMGHFWEVGTAYYLIYLHSSGQLVLYSPSGGTLASAVVPGYVATDWNTLTVALTASQFAISVNGTPYISRVVNREFTQGYVSLVNDRNVVWFDNFSVTASGDSVTPQPVTAAALAITPQGNRLSWTNPADTDWRWTRVMRKSGSFSDHWRDGYPVYEGKLTSFTDVDIVPQQDYRYTIFTCDHAGNYSDGTLLSPLVAVVDLKIAFLAETSQLRFSWTATGAPQYYLYSSPESDGEYSGPIAATAEDTLLLSPTASDQQFYVVRAGY